MIVKGGYAPSPPSPADGCGFAKDNSFQQSLFVNLIILFGSPVPLMCSSIKEQSQDESFSLFQQAGQRSTGDIWGCYESSI
jgi:hypothetical protein